MWNLYPTEKKNTQWHDKQKGGYCKYEVMQISIHSKPGTAGLCMDCIPTYV